MKNNGNIWPFLCLFILQFNPLIFYDDHVTWYVYIQPLKVIKVTGYGQKQTNTHLCALILESLNQYLCVIQLTFVHINICYSNLNLIMMNTL